MLAEQKSSLCDYKEWEHGNFLLVLNYGEFVDESFENLIIWKTNSSRIPLLESLIVQERSMLSLILLLSFYLIRFSKLINFLHSIPLLINYFVTYMLINAPL